MEIRGGHKGEEARDRVQLTFDDQGHDGVSDAERVARHAAVGAVVDGASPGDGDDRAVGANIDIVCGRANATLELLPAPQGTSGT